MPNNVQGRASAASRAARTSPKSVWPIIHLASIIQLRIALNTRGSPDPSLITERDCVHHLVPKPDMQSGCRRIDSSSERAGRRRVLSVEHADLDMAAAQSCPPLRAIYTASTAEAALAAFAASAPGGHKYPQAVKALEDAWDALTRS